jgi:hypothetical protein
VRNGHAAPYILGKSSSGEVAEWLNAAVFLLKAVSSVMPMSEVRILPSPHIQ